MKTKIRILILFSIFCILSFSLTSSNVHGIEDILLGQAGRPIFTLTVTGSGAGNGIITSNLYGINCTSTAGAESGACSVLIPMGTTIVLTATSSSMFLGWTGGGCIGAGTCSTLIDGNKTVDASFDIAPVKTNLIGWYKFNEGSGNIVINYATDGSSGGGLFPNLTVSNRGIADFWTFLVGFGSTQSLVGANISYAKADLGATRNFGGLVNGFAAYGIFYKRKLASNDIGGAVCSLFNVNADVPGTGTEIESSYNIFVANKSRDGYDWAGAGVPIDHVDTRGRWIFEFVDNSGKVNVILDDGTRLTSGVGLNMNAVINLQWLHSGVRFDNNYSCQGSYGDWIIYNFTRLTVAQWAIFYDNLRTRYGMAARSGW